MSQPRVTIINGREPLCGVYQFGKKTFEVLADSKVLKVAYREVAMPDELVAAGAECDLAIVNHYPSTMPWLTRRLVKSVAVPLAGIVHEFDHATAHRADSELFDYRFLPDPTTESRVPGVFITSRVAPAFVPPPAPGGIPVIGSFGFASPKKGFERIVKLVQKELDEAIIRLHIPPSHFGDPEGRRARETADRCRALVAKPGIKLEVTHDFKSDPELLTFLASNALNVFLYDEQPGRGISSCLDLAVAAGRPIAVSESGMFRNLRHEAPICRVERSSLRAILAAGADPILALKRAWTPENLRREYETAVPRILELHAGRSPDGGGLNTVLDDRARARLEPTIQELHRLVPDVMARKIERANVQQAFVKETVARLAATHDRPAILCVGSFEDTACLGLKKLGHSIEEIDPAINQDLATFFAAPTTVHGFFDVVFSTSVIEHVPDDEQFIEHIRDLLSPGGTAVLTMDFKPGYSPDDPRPIEDFRLYTQEDILARFVPLLHDCDLVDVPSWADAKPDFTYAGVDYCFATLVFRKRRVASDGHSSFEISLRVERLRNRIALLEADIAGFKSSKSWRLTAPLREIARIKRLLAK